MKDSRELIFGLIKASIISGFCVFMLHTESFAQFEDPTLEEQTLKSCDLRNVGFQGYKYCKLRTWSWGTQIIGRKKSYDRGRYPAVYEFRDSKVQSYDFPSVAQQCLDLAKKLKLCI